MRKYVGVNPKVRARKGEGSGQMRYLKDVARRFKKHFAEENVYKKALPTKEKKEKFTRAKIPIRKLH